MKRCSKCERDRHEDDFYPRKDSKDGLSGQCKLCKKDYQATRKEIKKEYDKAYRQANTEKRKIYGHDYWVKNKDKQQAYHSKRYENNKEVILLKTKKARQRTRNRYSLYASQLTPDDGAIKLNEGSIAVKCKLCGKFFTPTSSALQERVKALKGKATPGAENNFYCSDECKNVCPVFNFQPKQIDPRSKLHIPKTEQQQTRDCQTGHLKQLQCDDVGHNYCEKCGDIIDVELHHTHEVAKYGREAINSAGHILMCFRCHTELKC